MFSSAWPALLNKNLIDCQDIRQDLFGTFLCPGQGFCDDSLVWVFFKFSFYRVTVATFFEKDPILCQLSIVTHWDSWLYSINSGTTGCTTQLFSWMLSMSVKGMAFHRFFWKKRIASTSCFFIIVLNPICPIPWLPFHVFKCEKNKTKQKSKKTTAKKTDNRSRILLNHYTKYYATVDLNRITQVGGFSTSVKIEKATYSECSTMTKGEKILLWTYRMKLF